MGTERYDACPAGSSDSEDVLAGALRTAYNLRVEKNAKSGKKTGGTKRRAKRT